MSDKAIIDLESCAKFFKECLNENIIRLIFMPDRMVVAKKEDELNQKLMNSDIKDVALFKKAESQIVNILSMLLEEQEIGKIVDVMKDKLDTDNEEQIRKNIKYIEDVILDIKLKNHYLFFARSKSNKLLSYRYEINRKIIEKKELKTTQINLSILKPYSEFSQLKIDDIVFDVTLSDVNEFIKFFNEIKEEMENL